MEARTNRRMAVESGPIAFRVAFPIRCVPAERIWFRTSARITRRFVSMDSPAWMFSKNGSGSVPRAATAI